MHQEATYLLGGAVGREQQAERPIFSTECLPQYRRLLYLSHFFNQFSENSWQFCLVLFLAAFSNYESLTLVCSYGLVSSSFVFFFGPAAGRFVDGTNRLVVARKLIGYENCAVLLATGCCCLLLSNTCNSRMMDGEMTDIPRYQGVPVDLWSLFLLVCIHILGAAAKILDTGFLVAVERDWIVVLSKCAGSRGESPNDRLELQKVWLSETNVAMKQIDLGCKVVAPAVAGLVVAMFDDGQTRNGGSDLIGAAILVGVLNVSALVVELVCTSEIYRNVPALACKRVASSLTSDKEEQLDNESGKGEAVRPRKSPCFCAFPESLKVYWKVDVSIAGVGLSLLYLNVLSFGGIMTTYLIWKGMKLDSIGFWRGVSSLIGLLGTFVYRFLSKRMSLINTGMLSVAFQFLCLSLSYGSLFVDDLTASLIMLISGVCASRVGLWVFDIAVTQLFQLHVDDDVRGLVGGVQQSLNSFFGMLSFVLGILIPNPEYFSYYVSIGYFSVGLCVLCYGGGVYARRHHASLQDS